MSNPDHQTIDPDPNTEREAIHRPRFQPPTEDVTHDHEKQDGQNETIPTPGILRPQVYLPVLIALGQLMLLVGGWTFYLVTRSRPVPLPSGTAIFTKDHAQLSTLIVTLFSTLLALSSGYLYARAIRYTLHMSLSRPRSLFTIHSVVKIASKAPILNVRNMKWTLAGLISVAALALQTAAWSTLLTPRRIIVPTSMTGFELDLSQDEVVRATNMAFSLDTDHGTDIPVSVGTFLLSSGHSAVDGRYGRPSPEDFNGYTFINGTGGVSPANIASVKSSMGVLPNATRSRNATHQLPVNIVRTKSIESPKGFPTNYTVSQQGMTVQVQCEQRNLTRTTDPMWRIVSQPAIAFNNDGVNTTYMISKATTNCPGQQHNFTFLVQSQPHPYGVPNVLYFASCESQDDPVMRYIIQGTGLYGSIPTTLCTVKPKITTVQVHYTQFTTDSSAHLDRIEVMEPYESHDMHIPPSAQRSLVDDLFRQSQLTEHNTLGSSIIGFNEVVDENDRKDLNVVLENHIRGSFEVAATIVRATYTQTNNSLYSQENAPSNGTSPIPQHLRSPTTGIYRTETIGWHHTSTTAPLALLSPSFISIFSIIIILMSVFQIRREPGTLDGIGAQLDYFDPSDMLHVMAASSTGAFRYPSPAEHATDGDYLDHAKKVKVKLESKRVDGRNSSHALGLVHAN